MYLWIINEFPFICEICCGYQKSESHDQNDQINNPLNPPCQGLFVNNMFKKYQTSWQIFKHFTLMLFIRHGLW